MGSNEEKLKAFNKLVELYQSKLAEFGKASMARNNHEITKYEKFEKDLLDLKKFAQSLKNKDDPQLEKKIVDMNKRLKQLAVDSLHDQAEHGKKYQHLMGEVNSIIDKLLHIVETFDVTAEEKETMKAEFKQAKSTVQAQIQIYDGFIAKLNDMSAHVKTTDVLQITKEEIEPQIDLIIQKLAITKTELGGRHQHPSHNF